MHGKYSHDSVMLHNSYELSLLAVITNTYCQKIA